MEVNSYDYTVDKRSEGGYKLGRILMIVGYVIYCLAFLFVIIYTGLIPVGALIPVTLWILIFFTWRYVSIEYKYTVESGLFTLYKVYGGKKQKKLCELRLKDAVRILPANEYAEEIRSFAPSVIHEGRSTRGVSDGYAILYFEGERPAAIYIDAPEQSVKVLHYYNPDNTVRLKKGL